MWGKHWGMLGNIKNNLRTLGRAKKTLGDVKKKIQNMTRMARKHEKDVEKCKEHVAQNI